MVVAYEPLTGRVLFGPDQMSNRVKACTPPSRKEPIYLWPTVEADAEGIQLEDPEYFGESWVEPLSVVVVGYDPPVAVVVIRQVRWVGEHEVNALTRQL